MTKSTTDHIVYDSTDSEFRCRHCEDKSIVQDGATAELCLMRLRGFLLMHKLCQPKAAASPQLALPHTEPMTLQRAAREALGRIEAAEAEEDLQTELERTSESTKMQAHSPDGQHAPSPDYGTGTVTVATCWSELWPQLEDALAPHEYAAAKEDTNFPGRFNSVGFTAMAQWVAEELGEHERPLGPRPGQMHVAVRGAVEEARKRHAAAAAASEPKPRKKRTRKAA